MMNKLLLTCCFVLSFLPQGKSQWDDDLLNDSVMGIIDTSLISRYHFIQYAKNKFTFPTEESPAFEHFYARFDSLINRKKGQLVIYHIGGSHIQADVYSNKMRTWLNTYWPGMKGARGLVFPYTIAGTNNPYNYRAEGSGEWSALRCVIRKDTSKLGLLGISISTKDSLASMKIFYREKESMRYLHDRFKVYHNITNRSYKISFAYPEMVERVVEDTIAGFTQFFLKQKTDTAFFIVQRIINDTSSFTSYGIEMMNSDPGIVYNSIGVNGAAIPNYLRCQDWEKQLSQLPPDLFILSVGTNDANVPATDFDTAVYRRNYEEIVQKILRVNPKAAILFTVPNDAYYYRKYPNKNVAKTRDVIVHLSQKYQQAYWDFYGLMGEFGSSHTWYKEGLMHKDRVHFTWDGYLLKGDLFFEAFLKYLNEFEYRRLQKLTKEK